MEQQQHQSSADYDDWFLSEVEDGIAAADRGEFIEHEDVLKLINLRYPSSTD